MNGIDAPLSMVVATLMHLWLETQLSILAESHSGRCNNSLNLDSHNSKILDNTRIDHKDLDPFRVDHYVIGLPPIILINNVSSLDNNKASIQTLRRVQEAQIIIKMRKTGAIRSLRRPCWLDNRIIWRVQVVYKKIK